MAVLCSSRREERGLARLNERRATQKCAETVTNPWGCPLKTAFAVLQRLNMAPLCPVRCALQPLFSGEKIYTIDEIPNSDKLFQNGLCLPSGTNLSGEDQKKIINKILATLAKGN